MAQTDLIYDCAPQDGSLLLDVSIFASGAAARDEMRADIEAAGLRLRICGQLDALVEGSLSAIGDVILVDCPQVRGGDMATLSRLDTRAAQSGAQLIIATSIAGVDDVFGCCDQSAPQILVNPDRAQRVIALGTAMARFGNRRLRELSEDDRLMLLRLTEQVGQIAEQIGRFAPNLQAATVAGGLSGNPSVFDFGEASPASVYPAQSGPSAGDRLASAARPPLPDPRLVRQIIQHRQMRARYFDAGLFADPAWDILLDLTAARAEHIRVSVSSLCIAAGVPPTTALRWISQMTEAGLLERVEDEADRRRAFIALSDIAAEAMAKYFVQIDHSVAHYL